MSTSRFPDSIKAVLEVKLHGSEMYIAYEVALDASGNLSLTDDAFKIENIKLLARHSVNIIAKDISLIIDIKEVMKIKTPSMDVALLWARRLRRVRHHLQLPDCGRPHSQADQLALLTSSSSSSTPPPAPGPFSSNRGGRVFQFPKHVFGNIRLLSTGDLDSCDSALKPSSGIISRARTAEL